MNMNIISPEETTIDLKECFHHDMDLDTLELEDACYLG
jgi:hypothetical protein